MPDPEPTDDLPDDAPGGDPVELTDADLDAAGALWREFAPEGMAGLFDAESADDES